MATLFLGKCYLQCKFLESGFKKTTAFVMALIRYLQWNYIYR